MEVGQVVCDRCAMIPESVLSALCSTDIAVGEVRLTRQGQLSPLELDRGLGRKERQVLGELLQHYPAMVEFNELGDPLHPGEVNLLGIGAIVSELNAKLARYYLRVVRKQTRGYYLVEVQA